MKTSYSKGYLNAIVNENCDADEFYRIAQILRLNFDVIFINKLADPDSIYWDFIYNGSKLTMHYNIYTGISFYPMALTDASDDDNKRVAELAEALSVQLQKFKFVAKYFDPEPIQWGLRGDPLLWKDMKLKTARIHIPTSANELENLLHKLFKELTGESLKKDKSFYVEKYDTYGISKGMISCDFWLDKGFPLIIKRYINIELR